MKVKDRLFTDNDVIHHFKTEEPGAVAIITALQKLEYIESVEIRMHKFWSVATAGRTLALASAAKPILRKTADKKIAELLDRVTIVNSSSHYAYDVRTVVVFGSYLSDQDRISDIDIGIALEKKTANEDLFMKMCERSIQQASKDGRRFSSYAEQIYWPQLEVHRFLKSRSRAISLHSLQDEILQSAVQKIIFEKSTKS